MEIAFVNCHCPIGLANIVSVFHAKNRNTNIYAYICLGIYMHISFIKKIRLKISMVISFPEIYIYASNGNNYGTEFVAKINTLIIL